MPVQKIKTGEKAKIEFGKNPHDINTLLKKHVAKQWKKITSGKDTVNKEDLDKAFEAVARMPIEKMLGTKALARGEKFEAVVSETQKVFAAANISPSEVAIALNDAFACYNPFSEKTLGEGEGLSRKQLKFYHGEPVSRVNSKIWIATPDNAIVALCDFTPHQSDYLIFGMPNGNKTVKNANWPTLVSHKLPDYIETKQFPGGRVKYGIKPEWLVEFCNIMKAEGANKWVPKTRRIWRGESSTNRLGMDFCGSQEFMKTAEKTVEFMGATIYLKGDKGLIVSDKKSQLVAPGAEIEGTPAPFKYVHYGQQFINIIDDIIG